MSSARTSLLRHLTSFQARGLRASNQRRWAQVHDVRRFLATAPEPSRVVLEKYRAKLAAKAREEGHADIDSLKKAYSDRIDELRREAIIRVPNAEDAARLEGQIPVEAAPAANAGTAAAQGDAAAPAKTPRPAAPVSGISSSSGSSIKPLSAILDLPKARALPVRELSAIWRLRYASDPNSLCAVIPASTYAEMEATARTVSPHFVLPLPHPEQGAEMHFLQWTWDAASATSTVLFTSLAEYKLRGEFAAPHTSVTHYGELADEKGVVLMQGSVVEGRGVKPDDARWLVMCLQRFYGGWDDASTDQGALERASERRRLLEWFGKGDERFSVEKLMEEAERLG